jgi:hypothetical protein
VGSSCLPGDSCSDDCTGYSCVGGTWAIDSKGGCPGNADLCSNAPCSPEGLTCSGFCAAPRFCEQYVCRNGRLDPGGFVGPISLSCSDPGLSCYVRKDCTTSLSGTVYDPAGRNPVYNAAVFIPSDPAVPLPRITPGASSCDLCGPSPNSYLTTTTTDAKGNFSLTGVPATTNVPVVVQIGKWRREVAISRVTACTDNKVPGNTLRLPRSRAEGNLPQMALLTGGCDDLGCFLRSMGLDASEYSTPHGGGRLDVYQGLGQAGNGPALSSGAAGDCTGTTCPLWSTKQSLEYYDLVLLGCECAENNQTKADMTPMHDWLSEGGKILATHSQSTWFKNGPADFRAVANWVTGSVWGPSGPFSVDTSFPAGQVFQQWLANVGALNADGTVALGATNVSTSVSGVNPPTLRWIHDGSTTAAADGGAASESAKHLSFLTPISATPQRADAGQDQSPYCGKAAFTDIHAGGTPSGDVPLACSGAAMTTQQKALEFLFFDLAACL